MSRFYSGIAHLLFTSSICLGAAVFCVLKLRHVTALEWLTVPLTFLYANAAEYFGHKGPMHHRRRALSLVFKRHTLQHHRYFTDQDMECESFRDYKMILFPPVLILFFAGFFALPVGAAMYWLFSPNTAYLFVATALGYFLNYEWLHLAYHQKETSLLFKIPGLRALRRHHWKHHDPSCMAKSNFNITYPICDTLFRTRA